MFHPSRRVGPVVVWFAGTWLAAELVAATIGPAVVSPERYLAWFLPAASESSTREFVNDQGILLPDTVTGWRNRPDTVIEHWVIDSLGSRSPRPVRRRRRRAHRVLTLGSSTTNGGMGVTNDETIAAYLEDDSTEVLNFATMLYGADQVYLQWRSRLRDLDADVLVLGLDATPSAPLGNVYVPLLNPAETNMPFVKPRFRLVGDSLALIPAHPYQLLSGVPDNGALIRHFETFDDYAWVFDSFRRWGQTPLLAGLRAIGIRVRRWTEARNPPADRARLLVAVLHRLETEAQTAGSRVVMLLYPRRGDMASGGWRGRLRSDRYAATRDRLRSDGIEIVDVRAVLRQSGVPAGRLFHADGIHFTRDANARIAEAVAPRIHAAAAR